MNTHSSWDTRRSTPMWTAHWTHRPRRDWKPTAAPIPCWRHASRASASCAGNCGPTFDPVLDEPVPQRLRDAIAAPPAAVVDLHQRARAARSTSATSRHWGAARMERHRRDPGVRHTARLDIVPDHRRPAVETVQGRLVASGALDAALSTQPGGATTQAADAHRTELPCVADGSVLPHLQPARRARASPAAARTAGPCSCWKTVAPVQPMLGFSPGCAGTVAGHAGRHRRTGRRRCADPGAGAGTTARGLENSRPITSGQLGGAGACYIAGPRGRAPTGKPRANTKNLLEIR